MATIQQAAQFNALSYYVTGIDTNGTPIFKSDSPANSTTLPEGWAVYDVHTDAATGQTDVTFTNADSHQAYIAARGTANLGNVLGPDSKIALGISPDEQNSAALAYFDATTQTLQAQGYTSFQGGGHSLGGEEMAYVSSMRGIDVLTENAPNTSATTGQGEFGDGHIVQINQTNDLVGNWGPSYSNTITVDTGASTINQFFSGGTHSILKMNSTINDNQDLASQQLGAIDPTAIGASGVKNVTWSGTSAGGGSPPSWTTNADGSTTFAFSDSSTVTVAQGSDGTFVTNSTDGKGNAQTSVFNPDDTLLSDSWQHSDGGHGSDSFGQDGSSSGISYNTDLGYSTYTNDGQGNVQTDNYTADGTKTGDTWQHADSSYGSDTFNGDGSSNSEYHNADGSGGSRNDYADGSYEESRTAVDGSTHTDYNYSDGSSGRADTNADGSSSRYDQAADGSYSESQTNADGSLHSDYQNADGSYGRSEQNTDGSFHSEYQNADGSYGWQTDNADGTGDGRTQSADGSYSEYNYAGRSGDGSGETGFAYTSYNADYQNADGSHGEHIIRPDGSTQDDSYMADGSSSQYLRNADGSSYSENHGADGSYDWQNNAADGSVQVYSQTADGSYTEIQGNADGSNHENYLNADGSSGYSDRQTDGSYYQYDESADGSHKEVSWSTDGSSHSDYVNADGTSGGTDQNADGSTDIYAGYGDGFSWRRSTDADGSKHSEYTDQNGTGFDDNYADGSWDHYYQGVDGVFEADASNPNDGSFSEAFVNNVGLEGSIQINTDHLYSDSFSTADGLWQRTDIIHIDGSRDSTFTNEADGTHGSFEMEIDGSTNWDVEADDGSFNREHRTAQGFHDDWHSANGAHGFTDWSGADYYEQWTTADGRTGWYSNGQFGGATATDEELGKGHSIGQIDDSLSFSYWNQQIELGRDFAMAPGSGSA